VGAGNDYVWGGASKYSGASNGPNRNRSKEGDEAFLPRGRTYPNEYPSFVTEVGVSGSLAELRNDAAFWLLSTGGRCRRVLVVAVRRHSRQIVLELYRRVQVTCGPVTRATPHPPTRFDIGLVLRPIIIHQDSIQGPPGFDLPLDVLLDVVPNEHQGKVATLTAEALGNIAKKV
jgi:hypothetical protein